MRTSAVTEPAPGHPNEDVHLANDTVAVVLDGATIPKGATTSCHHTTQWFAQTLGEHTFAQLTGTYEQDLRQVLADSIAWFAAHHATTCDIHDAAHPSATVMILHETENGYDYLVLGDSTLVFYGPTGIKVVTDHRLQENIAPLLRARLQHLTRGSAEHDAARADLLAGERAGRNTEGGYWIAATDPTAAYQALVGHVEFGHADAALLLTDGASVLVDRFGTLDWNDLLDLARNKGPRAVIDQVRTVESDPDIARLPRSKPHDDATLIYCELQRRALSPNLA